MMAEIGGGLTLIYFGLYLLVLYFYLKGMNKSNGFTKMLQYLINAQVVLLKYPDFKEEKTTINREVFPFIENIARSHLRMLDVMVATRSLLLVGIANQVFFNSQLVNDFLQILLVIIIPAIITYQIRWLPTKWKESDAKCDSVSVIVEAAQIPKKER